MKQIMILSWLLCGTVSAENLRPVRIAVPVDGHIHPAVCLGKDGTIVVTYGRTNHTDLRLTRSSDGGRSWEAPVPFVHTVDRTYYPGSLTTLADGRLLHCWNRWDTPVTQKEPRSVLYSLSDDGGITWSEPQAFPHDPEVKTVIRHPVVDLGNGKWLVSLWDLSLIHI